MERNEIHTWRKWELVVNVLLIAMVMFTVARVAWGLDTQDIISRHEDELVGFSLRQVGQ